MIALLDTDIIIDFALDRKPFSDDASSLLGLLEKGMGTGYIAWHSVANLYYLVKPAKGHGSTSQFIEELISFVAIAPTTTNDLHTALRLSMKDFEDAMQVAAAMACQADFIVTRNLRDFKNSPVRAVSAKKAASLISAEK